MTKVTPDKLLKILETGTEKACLKFFETATEDDRKAVSATAIEFFNKIRKDLFVDQHGPAIVWAAMDHAMANRNRRKILCVFEPRRRHADRRRHVSNRFRCIGPIHQDRIVGTFHPQSRLRSDAVQLALDQPL